MALMPVAADESFRCNFCRQISNQGYNVNGKFYCKPHVNEALPKCHNCETAIRGNYVTVSPKRYPVCSSCRDGLPRCFLCSLPSDPSRGGLLLGDGRALCPREREHGITDSNQAKRVFKQAEGEIRQAFGGRLALRQPVSSVHLVGLKELQLASRHSGHGAASDGRVLGVATIRIVRQGDKTWMEPSTVHLLDRVPEERMLTVATHEYAHVWHAENHKNYSQVHPELREGFAEWVAYRVAHRFKRPEQLALMDNSAGGVYYRGLRKFLELERQRGVEGVLEFATEATTI